MVWLDYITIIASFSIIMAIGLAFAKRVSNSTDEFMVGGRKLPWWLAGTSLSAGSFNSDTPLHNSRRVRQNGLAGLWLYLSQLITHTLAAVVFVKFARRSGISTWVEIYEIRHGGRAGRWTRIFNVFFQGLYGKSIWLILGLIAMIKVTRAIFVYPETFSLPGLTFNSDLMIMVGAVVFAMIYSAASGLWGVVATDFIEFFIALACSFVLTMIVLKEVGWGGGLYEKLSSLQTESGQSFFNIMPEVGLPIFMWLVIVPWSGSSQICTNMRYLAAKDEKEAILSGVWQVFNNFILRSWPWWIAGLASVVLLADLADAEMAYPTMIREYLPAGLRGLMIAGFMSAFLSTIDTSFHEMSSVFLNDLYRPFIKPGASEKHYLRVARIVIVIMAAICVTMAAAFSDILGILMFALKVGGMHGIIALYRWFWWRLNGWADFVGNVLAIPVGILLHFDLQIAQALGFQRGPTDFFIDLLGERVLGCVPGDARWALQYAIGLLFITVVVTLLSYLAPKNDPECVEAFYARIRPYGVWGPVAEKTGVRCADSFIKDMLMTALSLTYVFLGLYAVGLLFFQNWLVGLLLGVLSLSLGVLFVKIINRHYAKDETMKAMKEMEHAQQHRVDASTQQAG
jgi:Na+/proline symporter